MKDELVEPLKGGEPLHRLMRYFKPNWTTIQRS